MISYPASADGDTLERAQFLFPACDPGNLLRLSDGAVFARTLPDSVLVARPDLVRSGVVLWSGTYTQLDSPEVPNALFEPSPHNWGPRGWAALDESVKAWADAGLGASLLIRTHAAHIISDAPSAIRFARQWNAAGVRVAYDPVSMVTPAMSGSSGLADLYARLVDSLEHPDLRAAVAFVMVCNFELEGTGVRPCSLDAGLLDPALLGSVIDRCADLGLPVAMLGSDSPTYTAPE